MRCASRSSLQDDSSSSNRQHGPRLTANCSPSLIVKSTYWHGTSQRLMNQAAFRPSPPPQFSQTQASQVPRGIRSGVLFRGTGCLHHQFHQKLAQFRVTVEPPAVEQMRYLYPQTMCAVDQSYPSPAGGSSQRDLGMSPVLF